MSVTKASQELVSREPEVSKAKPDAVLLTPVSERETLLWGSGGSKGPRFSLALINGGLYDALVLCKD